MKYLAVKHIEIISHGLASFLLNKVAEPIPPFREVTMEKLESALARPMAGTAEAEFYPTLTSKSAALFYSMVKNHPFPNGNKRIATTTLLTFLHINDHWIQAANEEVEAVAIAVANSDATRSVEVLYQLEFWLANRLIGIDANPENFLTRMVNFFRRA